MTEAIYVWGFFHSPPPDIIATYYRKQGCQVLVAAPFSSPGSQRLKGIWICQRTCLKQKVKTQRQKKDRHLLLYCSIKEEILWFVIFLC